MTALLLLIQAGITVPNAAAESLPVLTSARALRALRVEEARKQYRVRIRAVVTYVDSGPGQELFVQDASAGTFLFLSASLADNSVRTGSLVEVDGWSTAGSFAPCVTRARIRVLGTAKLPHPIRPSYDPQLASQDDGQWARVEGVVRSGKIENGRLMLNLVSNGESFVVIMAEFNPDWAKTFIDARVRVTGVLAALFNERRQALGMKIFVPNGFVKVISAAPLDPFDLPISSASSIGQFRPGDDTERRIRVRGIVTATEPGIAAYLTDGRENLEIQSSGECPAKPGDLVDVVGFPATIGHHSGLQDSLCRKVSGAAAVSSVAVQAEEVLLSRTGMDPSGYGFSGGIRYDLRLVRIEGILVQHTRGLDGQTFLVVAGKRQFTALLRSQPDASESLLVPGTSLRFTGVCLVSYDQYSRAQSFQILLRSWNDIKIESSPPWWNLYHALWGLAALLICFLGTMTWISVLRARVANQTLELRQANEALQLLSSRDGLTGAANRRKFDETLNLEWARASRNRSPVSLLMLDIDHFKTLNDTHGHPCGDECLVRVVGAIRSIPFRKTDLIARYGGEEFAILLPGTNREEALVLAERVRTAVEELAIPNAGSPARPQIVTVSVGVAVDWPSPLNSPAALVTSADHAMYESKTAGRNRVSASKAREVCQWETTISS